MSEPSQGNAQGLLELDNALSRVEAALAKTRRQWHCGKDMMAPLASTLAMEWTDLISDAKPEAQPECSKLSKTANSLDFDWHDA